jgi:hypothetical protein
MKDYYSLEEISKRTEINYSMLRDTNKSAVRNLDLGELRHQIQTNLSLIEHLLDEQYSLFGIEAKIASNDLYDFKKERLKDGHGFGYLTPSVEYQKKTLSCRFYKRTPNMVFGKSFHRKWLNPGKTRKISYQALQKASADADELRIGMHTEVTFRLVREACVDISKMRTRIALLLDMARHRKGIREIFKMDPWDITRPSKQGK